MLSLDLSDMASSNPLAFVLIIQARKTTLQRTPANPMTRESRSVWVSSDSALQSSITEKTVPHC